MSAAPHKILPEAMIQGSNWLVQIVAPYVQGGRTIANSRMVPLSLAVPPVGTWKIDDSFNGMYGHSIEQLREFNPHDLDLAEDMVETNEHGRGNDAERYAQWRTAGTEPPPISVVETDQRRLRVIDGHRRVGAAKRLGLPIKAWVSPAVETGALDYYGKPMLTGLTHELAVMAALDARKAVPAALVQRYAAKIAEIRKDVASSLAFYAKHNSTRDKAKNPATARGETMRSKASKTKAEFRLATATAVPYSRQAAHNPRAKGQVMARTKKWTQNSSAYGEVSFSPVAGRDEIAFSNEYKFSGFVRKKAGRWYIFVAYVAEDGKVLFYTAPGYNNKHTINRPDLTIQADMGSFKTIRSAIAGFNRASMAFLTAGADDDDDD